MYWCSRVLLLAAVTVCASSSTAVTPLQAAIDAAIASGASSYSLDPGATYQQGNASLVIRASSFAVHGNGATLVFFPTAGVLIDGSSDVAVTDLTVTYSPRCFTQGAVVAYDAQHNTIDVKLDAGFPTPDAPWFTSTVETKLQFFDGATRLRSLGQSGSCIVNVASSPSPGVWRVAVASGFRCSVPPLAGLLATISPRVNAPAYQIPQGAWCGLGRSASIAAAARAPRLTLLTPHIHLRICRRRMVGVQQLARLVSKCHASRQR